MTSKQSPILSLLAVQRTMIPNLGPPLLASIHNEVFDVVVFVQVVWSTPGRPRRLARRGRVWRWRVRGHCEAGRLLEMRTAFRWRDRTGGSFSLPLASPRCCRFLPLLYRRGFRCCFFLLLLLLHLVISDARSLTNTQSDSLCDPSS